MREIEERGDVRGWPAVVALALATFTVVTSEMLPVGLLTPIGTALGVTEGTAGLTLTVTGVVAALSAPLLVPAFGATDRRAVLGVLMGLLALGNLVAAWSPSFAVLVVARVLVGFGVGGVWALAGGLAARLAPPASVGTATSLVFSGVAVASVLGVPTGTHLGEVLGWRAAFAVVAGSALVVVLALLVVLPRLPVDRPVRLGGTVRLAAHPPVATGLAVVSLVVVGHFAAYTYVRPVLEGVAGVEPGAIAALLLVYGVAGVAGTFAGGAGAARSPRATLLVVSGVLAATVALVPVAGTSAPAAAGLLVVWGLAYGAVSVSTQTWLLAAAPHAHESASALFSGVFNGAIALGALGGGLVADGFGLVAVMWLGAALTAAAVPVLVRGRAPAPAERPARAAADR
ncbi:MFS transporter [Saccharothrix algeriensis]|uniref:MFS family arabinose efflux permease n=1 Tax=Saccharothrix algeriensis TaxID=173560 RepID=A0ABS2SF09_9PSEU|nr:MFS transporter [Saccharothrix algeriensis]MBM7814857.1 putative MFS family arabinose efflux permease [Saccharothrix algeriensis]